MKNLFSCVALMAILGVPPALAQPSVGQPAANPEVKALPAKQASRMAWRDKRYMIALAQLHLGEINLAGLAKAKAVSSGTTEFAAHMANFHGESLESLKVLAGSRKVDLPKRADERQRKLARHLNELSGAGFEREYLISAQASQKSTLKLISKIESTARDEDLIDAASAARQGVENHLAMITDLRRKK